MTLEGNLMIGSIPTEWGGMTDLEALELVRVLKVFDLSYVLLAS